MVCDFCTIDNGVFCDFYRECTLFFFFLFFPKNWKSLFFESFHDCLGEKYREYFVYGDHWVMCDTLYEFYLVWCQNRIYRDNSWYWADNSSKWWCFLKYFCYQSNIILFPERNLYKTSYRYLSLKNAPYRICEGTKSNAMSSGYNFNKHSVYLFHFDFRVFLSKIYFRIYL